MRSLFQSRDFQAYVMAGVQLCATGTRLCAAGTQLCAAGTRLSAAYDIGSKGDRIPRVPYPLPWQTSQWRICNTKSKLVYAWWDWFTFFRPWNTLSFPLILMIKSTSGLKWYAVLNFEVCHCFDDAEVNFQRRFEYFRAIACNACAADDDSAPDDLLQHVRNNDERQTVIGMIARIENLASGPDEYHIITKNILRRHWMRQTINLHSSINEGCWRKVILHKWTYFESNRNNIF